MSKPKMTPPNTDEDMESKLVSLAMRQAGKQLEDGTASSQVVTHFLKLGSIRAQSELAKIDLESKLLEERIASEQGGQQLKEMVKDVLAALKSYTYLPPGEDHADIF